MEKIIQTIPTPEDVKNKTKQTVRGFFTFIREQGVVGLAIGFILGGAVSKVVTSLVADVINPLIGVLLGGGSALVEKQIFIGQTAFKWGSFVATIVDFVIIAAVVYFGFKLLGIEKLDKKKEK